MKVKRDLLVTKAVGQPLSDDPSEAKRKLSNIRPREVSLVDSAANGRSFLIVKRSEDMKKKDKALFKGEGEAEGEKPEAKPEGAQPADAPKPEAGTAEPPAAEGGEEGAEAAAEEVAVEKVFTKLAEDALQTIPVAKALVMEQKTMFMAMADALMGMAMTMDMVRMDLMSFVGSDGKTGFMGEEVIKSVKAVLKKAEPNLTEDELTEKAGRKMKGDRMSKLKDAVGVLQSLLKELEGDANVKKGGETVSKEKEKKDQETKKSTEGSSDAAATTETPAADATPESKETEVVKAADVQKIVDAAVEKATKPLKEEIDALKKAPAESASESSDETEDTETNKSKDGKTSQSIFKGIIR